MGVTGIQTLTFGVEDMDVAERFWTDFGLAKVDGGDGERVFEAANKSTVVVRPIDDPALPPAVIPGSTVRETTWAVESAADLDALADALAADREVTRDADGTVHSTDTVGYGIGFGLSRLIEVQPAELAYNTPGAEKRIDARGEIYENAAPQYLSHVVFKVPNLEETLEFYRDRLGFKMTDCYPDQGYFLRGGASSDHHNLFLLNVGEDKGFHHVAFELRNVHELFGGGLNMSTKGWETHLGPGRHPISSCYFWYFKNPCGGAAEYDWDSDHVTDDWQPREWPRVPQAFAEWALETGMQLYGGVQTGSV